MVSDINALVRSLLAPAMAIDEHGRITAVNGALTRFLEGSASELVGSQLAVHIADATAAPDFLSAASVRREVRFRTGKGGERDIALSLLVKAPAGGAVLSAFDLTAQRIAERREREMERRLLHVQKLEALGTLAGGVAHDLNNTLVPILALTKLTANRLPAESRERSNLVTVMEACERARSLVQRILAFSRKQNSEKRAFDLAATVREALRMLRASLPATVQIVERVANVPNFFGDSSQLHQVVVNLVTNAAQAIGTAMGTITVELRQDRDAGLCLAVSDTGCGMDEATAARIFEPFFTTKDVGQGTGLGLSLVHGIVSSHGGRIKVTSRVGEGTSFEVYLPFAPPAAQTHKTIEEARAAKYRSIAAAPPPSRIARKTAARSR
jgi:signal transduction histidine kinase